MIVPYHFSHPFSLNVLERNIVDDKLVIILHFFEVDFGCDRDAEKFPNNSIILKFHESVKNNT